MKVEKTPVKNPLRPTIGSASDPVIAWFVFKYLLGFKSVKHYDGFRTEWRILVGTWYQGGAFIVATG